MNLMALELALRLQFPLWHSGLSCQLDHKRSHCGERIAARDSCGKKHTDLNRGLMQGHRALIQGRCMRKSHRQPGHRFYPQH